MNEPVQCSLLHLSLTEAAAAVKDGSITSVALTTAALEAFSRVDKVINSSIWLEGTVALEAAEDLDKKRRSGAKLGPLHGIPLAHKDMYYKAGKLSTCGSSIRKDFRPAYTATVIERLEEAGSGTLGGLNMAEFAQNP
ncbi:MAG: amidase family protein, partial [Hyphomicrobiales bacterium]|nr:amidase family protein [Hyphomicrobiales bacterium]